MPAKVYKPVWKCIYCRQGHSDAEPLGREHIVPFAFVGNGGLVLPRASCRVCGGETGKFETYCSHELFGSLRIVLGAPTRNPESRPTHLSVTVIPEDGESAKVEVPIQDYPYVSFNIPQFDLPNVLAGRPWTGGQRAKLRSFDATMLDKPKVSDGLGLESGRAEVEVLSTFSMVPLYKMLCKIAHSCAVAEKGLDSYEWLLPELSVGSAENYSDYVGGWSSLPDFVPASLVPEGPFQLPGQVFFELSCGPVSALNRIDYLVVKVTLFYDLCHRLLWLLPR